MVARERKPHMPAMDTRVSTRAALKTAPTEGALASINRQTDKIAATTVGAAQNQLTGPSYAILYAPNLRSKELPTTVSDCSGSFCDSYILVKYFGLLHKQKLKRSNRESIGWPLYNHEVIARLPGSRKLKTERVLRRVKMKEFPCRSQCNDSNSLLTITSTGTSPQSSVRSRRHAGGAASFYLVLRGASFT